ncbi:FAD dependent oxidoreductase [Xylariomycetidae sp. FL0641]|nr:FAD dependent oxidoreductase [Xylariomycetidae sp. FL0641]
MLPVPNATQPYWRTEPHQLDTHRSTAELPSSCDVLIIGAGMSGVSTAYHLSQESPTSAPPSIVLLEAREVCSGATGRNGGHVKVKTTTMLSLIETLGPAAAEAFLRFSHAHIGALKDVVAREGLDCEFELRRSFDVFAGEAEAARVREAWDAALARGEAWTRDRDLVVPAHVETVTAVRGARVAFSAPACSLWPYKFVTQLLERAIRRNPRLNLQTNTPVLGVEEKEGGETVVRTPRGDVRTRKVVFATNGYTAGLLRQYQGVITPYKGTAAHLAPSAEKGPVFPHLSNTYNLDWGLKEHEPTVDYFNPRPDGGIVVGGGNWLYKDRKELWWDTIDDSTQMEAVVKSKYFDDYMQRNFRGWENSETQLDRTWTGIMGATGDSMPHIGQVPGTKGHFLLAGYNGGGMPLIFLLSKALAQMVREGIPFEETDEIVPKMFKTTETRMKSS